MPQIMAITVDPPAMSTELSKYLAMGARLQISIKLDHMAVIGRMVPLGEKISTRLLRAVQNMAK